MRYTKPLTAFAITLVMGAGLAVAPLSAKASQEGRRNTALGLGAAAAALLLTQKDKTAGVIAGVGALIAASRIGHDDRYRYYGYRDDRYYGSYDRYDNRYDRDRWDRNRDRDRDRDHDRYDRDRNWNRDNNRDWSRNRDSRRGDLYR